MISIPFMVEMVKNMRNEGKLQVGEKIDVHPGCLPAPWPILSVDKFEKRMAEVQEAMEWEQNAPKIVERAEDLLDRPGSDPGAPPHLSSAPKMHPAKVLKELPPAPFHMGTSSLWC